MTAPFKPPALAFAPRPDLRPAHGLSHVRDFILAVRPARFFALSFLITAALPALAAASYFYALAPAEFISEARFAIRAASDRPLAAEFALADAPQNNTGPSAPQAKAQTQTPASLLERVQALAAPASAQDARDPFIAAQFLRSADALAQLDADGFLTTRYRKGQDVIFGLGEGATREALARVWRRLFRATADSISGTVTIESHAFTPEDARDIAGRALKLAETAINHSAAESRARLMASAQDALNAAEARYLSSLEALNALRRDLGAVDPASEIAAAIETSVMLSQARIALSVERAAAARSLSRDAPQLRALDARIAALDAELDAIRSRLTGSPGASASVLTRYEEAETARMVAAGLYAQAEADFEQTRLAAERQAVTFAVFAPPSLPSEAQGPDRLGGALAAAGLAFAVWAMLVLALAALRDRLS